MEVKPTTAVPTCKVAMIEPVGGHGGMDYYDFGLCEGLGSTCADVLLYTCDETLQPKHGNFSVRHAYLGIYGQEPAWKRGFRYVSGSIKALLHAVLDKRKICHFHLFHVAPLQLMNIVLARLLLRRIVITAHDVESFVESLDVPALSRWVYRHADRVIAHNEISKQELVQRIGLPEDRISVIPHGNYLQTNRPLPPQTEARKALNIHENAKVVLFFGQIKDVKGLDLLIDAMALVVKRHPEAVLLIAGKPWKSSFSTYTTQIEQHALQKHCICHIRYIPDEEVPLFYGAADIVVLPYRRIYQSGVVLMAMSYGKAVLVSDLPGMTELVSGGVNGYVFRQGETSDLIQQLCLALDDEAERCRLAEQGFQHVRDGYNWQSIGISTRKLYECLQPEYR